MLIVPSIIVTIMIMVMIMILIPVDYVSWLRVSSD